jgi:hypothetical protein
MDILCPNCRERLEPSLSVPDAFLCPKEGIAWILIKRKDSQYLEKVYAPGDYRGPNEVKVEKN